MREKYDSSVKLYYISAVIVSLLLLFLQSLAFLEVITLFVTLLFSLYSIAALLKFVKKEYNKQLYVVPIYFIAISQIYFVIRLLSPQDVMQYSTVFGIVLSMTLLVYSLYILAKIKK